MWALAALLPLWCPAAQAGHYTLPLFVTSTAPGAAQGVLRIVNGAGESGSVEIRAIDDAGIRHGPAAFTLDAGAAVEFDASDLASGNAVKGLSPGLGTLPGDVRLQIETELRIVPLAYVRAADGTLSAMHDTVRAGAAAGGGGGYRYEVPTFNAASDVTRESRLRLINPGDRPAAISIEGRDDTGAEATGGAVRLTLPSGGARTLTARQLEAGDAGAMGQTGQTGQTHRTGQGEGAEAAALTGQLGAGVGRWRLSVSSDRPIRVVNVVSTASGYLNNLSTTAVAGMAPQDREAFNRRFAGVGIEYRTDSGEFTFAAAPGDTAGTGSGDTFTETGQVGGMAVSLTGSYAYRAIGPDAGRVAVSYGGGGECGVNLYFDSPAGGWFASFCTGTEPPGGHWVAGDWSIVDDTPETGSPGDCRVGMLVGIGQNCAYPGTADAFSVNVRGRGRFLHRLAGIRIDIGNETVDGRVYDFRASHQGDGVWRIDRIAGSTEPPMGAPADVRSFAVDFRDGPQGFVADFADLPATDTGFYELMSGFGPLPSPLGPEQALFVSGRNHSADLFMFFKGQVGGLAPGARYNAAVSVEIATDTPSGCAGIGGAPGESVSVKAGVSGVEPLPVVEGNYLRMNIDTGNQSRGGGQAVVLGDVANSRPCEQPPRWERKSFPARSVPEPVTASPDGRVWLLFGTDSGFEGRTQIYFTQATVTLTPI